MTLLDKLVNFCKVSKRFERFVTASSDRSLNTLTEVENLVEMVHRSGQAPIVTDPLCLRGEICSEAVGASTNTYQPVLVFVC